jgi:hypothetical protein
MQALLVWIAFLLCGASAQAQVAETQSSTPSLDASLLWIAEQPGALNAGVTVGSMDDLRALVPYMWCGAGPAMLESGLGNGVFPIDRTMPTIRIAPVAHRHDEPFDKERSTQLPREQVLQATGLTLNSKQGMAYIWSLSVPEQERRDEVEFDLEHGWPRAYRGSRSPAFGPNEWIRFDLPPVSMASAPAESSAPLKGVATFQERAGEMTFEWSRDLDHAAAFADVTLKRTSIDVSVREEFRSWVWYERIVMSRDDTQGFVTLELWPHGGSPLRMAFQYSAAGRLVSRYTLSGPGQEAFDQLDLSLKAGHVLEGIVSRVLSEAYVHPGQSVLDLSSVPELLIERHDVAKASASSLDLEGQSRVTRFVIHDGLVTSVWTRAFKAAGDWTQRAHFWENGNSLHFLSDRSQVTIERRAR